MYNLESATIWIVHYTDNERVKVHGLWLMVLILELNLKEYKRRQIRQTSEILR